MLHEAAVFRVGGHGCGFVGSAWLLSSFCMCDKRAALFVQCGVPGRGGGVGEVDRRKQPSFFLPCPHTQHTHLTTPHSNHDRALHVAKDEQEPEPELSRRGGL